MNTEPQESRSRFLSKNLFRGLAWFGFLILVYILIEDRLRQDFHDYGHYLVRTPITKFIVFTVSELCFGIIPPEFFMIISILENISLPGYIQNLMAYAWISYLSGIAAFYIGYRFSKTPLYDRIRKKYLGQYELKLKQYGGFLVIVGAVTPIPFSATCMLAGAADFPFRKFVVISTYRFLRFGVYGWLVWNFPKWFGG